MPFQDSAITIGPRRFTRFSQNGWAGWIRAEWADAQCFQNLDEWLAHPDGTIVLDTLCRTIIRETIHGKGTVYAKLMRAQNDGVIQKNELFSKFKWICYPSRARCILKTTAHLLACGHACPEPILGIRRKNGLGMPTDLFVATELTDPTVEDRLKNAASPEEQKAILAICGQELARFHRDGFVHGDFLPRNTCLSLDNTTVSYLDNDRTRRWPKTPLFHFQRRNLTQFCFNLYVLNRSDNPELPDALLNAYATAAGWSDARRDAERKTIFAQNARRWAATARKELRNS